MLGSVVLGYKWFDPSRAHEVSACTTVFSRRERPADVLDIGPPPIAVNEARPASSGDTRQTPIVVLGGRADRVSQSFSSDIPRAPVGVAVAGDGDEEGLPLDHEEPSVREGRDGGRPEAVVK